MMFETSHVFLSYARADGKELVKRLEADLNAQGFQTWLDKRNLNEYHDFSAEIENAIRIASHVVVCITPSIEQNPSSFVRREIMYAQSKNKPIIPLVFPGASVPLPIIHLTWIPFFDAQKSQPSLHYDEGFSELIVRLQTEREAVSAPGSQDPFHQYLLNLYDSVVSYLDKTVFSLITLESEARPEAVDAPIDVQALPMAFWDTAMVMNQKNEQDRSFIHFQDAFERYNGRVLLLGDPGAGKTTTLMAFARDAIVRRLENPANPLPIMAPLAAWDSQKDIPLSEWLPEIIPMLDRSLLTSQIEQGSTLLLLDGLDELGSVNEDPVTKEHYDPRLRLIQRLPGRNQIVLTSRIKDYEAIREKAPLQGCVTLRPLGDAQVNSYLTDLPVLRTAIQSDAELREITRNPLLLSLFTFAFAETDAELAVLYDLSMGDLRDRIFEMYVLRRYEREQRKTSSDISFTLDEIYEVLGYASMERILTFLGDTSLINAEMLRDGKVIEPGANLETFVRQVELLNLATRYDAEHIRFMHLLMRDYFGYKYASQLLLSKDKETRKKAILALTELRDPRSKNAVVQALSEFEDYPNVVWRCIQVLAEIGDSTVAAGLAPFVHDNEPDIRIAAAATLRQLGDHLAIIPLLELAEDRSQFIKKFVADEVRQIRDVRAADGLIIGLSNNNPMIARAAFDALTHIGADAVMPLLIVLEHSTVNTVRQLAIEALGEIADNRATQALLEALHDDSQVNLMQRICDIAADALERIGTEQAIAAVEKWRQQENR